MHFRNIYMKKVLIVGYGDLGHRMAGELTNVSVIAVSRSKPLSSPNVQWVEWDWYSGKKLQVNETHFDTIVLIPKPNGSDEGGYKKGYIDGVSSILSQIDALNYDQLIAISSTRIYGTKNGKDITESSIPEPDDFRGKIILQYEQLVVEQSKIAPLILRPSGLYSEGSHWMQRVINEFTGSKFQLSTRSANRFSRDVLAHIIAKCILQQEMRSLSGSLICSEPAKEYAQIYKELFADNLFEDYFAIPAKNSPVKTFKSQKLFDLDIMG